MSPLMPHTETLRGTRKPQGAKLLDLRRLPKFPVHVYILYVQGIVIVDLRQFSVVTTVL
jgi:hypothetical protein